MTKSQKKWKIADASAILKSKQYPAWLLSILANRGIKTEDELESFLDPKYEDLLDPSAFQNMTAAVTRVTRAVGDDEKIVVYGDYDVDGATSTALMFEVLKKIGARNVETYIPHREDEGYGLNREALTELKNNGTKLVITVDCGVSSAELIDSPDFSELDFVICDHHEIHKDSMPKRAVIIHPSLVEPLDTLDKLGAGAARGKKVEPQKLCACGMAFFFAKGLQKEFADKFPIGQEKWLLDLVALGTICDVVPLVGQNRILAKFGLMVLAKTKRIGLVELAKTASFEIAEVSSYAVGFLLGPRLNAAGRIEHAKSALELLLTESQAEAKKIAEKLNSLNTDRQEMCSRILEEATKEIEDGNKKHHEIFLLSNKNWPRGVVGIIASKLADRYSRPVIIFENDGGVHHGSARSVDGLDITEALNSCGEHLIKFGGHAKAAGLTVSDEHFVILSEKLLEIAKGKLKKEDLLPVVNIDAVLKPGDIDDNALELLARMEPFGFGNSTPVFVIENAELENIKKVGDKAQHLKFNLKNTNFGGIWFGFDKEAKAGDKYDLAFNLRYNEWQNRKSIELRTIDLR